VIRGQEKVSSRSEGIVGRTAEVGYLKWCLSVAPLEAEIRLRVTDTQHSIFFCLYGLLWRPAHGGDRRPLDHVIPRVPVRQWVLSFPIPFACCSLRIRSCSRPSCRSSTGSLPHF
jgi:hypothetical protein